MWGGGSSPRSTIESVLQARTKEMLNCLTAYDRVGYKSFFSTNYMASYYEQNEATRDYIDANDLPHDIDYQTMMYYIDYQFDLLAAQRRLTAESGVTIQVSYQIASFKVISSTDDTALVSEKYVIITKIVSEDGQTLTQEIPVSGKTAWVKEGSTWRIVSGSTL